MSIVSLSLPSCLSLPLVLAVSLSLSSCRLYYFPPLVLLIPFRPFLLLIPLHRIPSRHIMRYVYLKVITSHHVLQVPPYSCLFLSFPFLSSSAPSLIFFLYVIHEYYLAKLAKSLEGPEGCLEAPALLLVCAPKVEGSACGLAVPEEPVPDRNRDLRFP